MHFIQLSLEIPSKILTILRLHILHCLFESELLCRTSFVQITQTTITPLLLTEMGLGGLSGGEDCAGLHDDWIFINIPHKLGIEIKCHIPVLDSDSSLCTIKILVSVYAEALDGLKITDRQSLSSGIQSNLPPPVCGYIKSYPAILLISVCHGYLLCDGWMIKMVIPQYLIEEMELTPIHLDLEM